MHNMLAAHKDHCQDITSRIRNTFYDRCVIKTRAAEIARDTSKLGTYYSMEEATRLTLEAFHMAPLKLHQATRELGIEHEFDIPFLELVELLTPHLIGMTLGDPAVLIEERRRARKAAADFDEHCHAQARRDQRIAS